MSCSPHPLHPFKIYVSTRHVHNVSLRKEVPWSVITRLLKAFCVSHLWIALPTALTTCADVLVSRTGGRSQTSCKSKCAALSSSEYDSSSSSARDSGRTCKDLDIPGGIACHGVSPPFGQHGYTCKACDSLGSGSTTLPQHRVKIHVLERLLLIAEVFQYPVAQTGNVILGGLASFYQSTGL